MLVPTMYLMSTSIPIRFQNRVEQQQLLKSQMYQAFAIFAQDASQQQRFEQRPMMAQYFDDQSHRASPFMVLF